jgi:hypothetical protein
MTESISKEEFAAYVAVQRKGRTNMFAIDVVAKLSGLSREKVSTIMVDYGKLATQYPDVINEGH